MEKGDSRVQNVKSQASFVFFNTLVKRITLRRGVDILASVAEVSTPARGRLETRRSCSAERTSDPEVAFQSRPHRHRRSALTSRTGSLNTVRNIWCLKRYNDIDISDAPPSPTPGERPIISLRDNASSMARRTKMRSGEELLLHQKMSDGQLPLTDLLVIEPCHFRACVYGESEEVIGLYPSRSTTWFQQPRCDSQTPAPRPLRSAPCGGA